jgi:hypothetical protein
MLKSRHFIKIDNFCMSLSQLANDFFWQLLINEKLRFLYAKTRFLFLRKNLKFYNGKKRDNFNDVIVEYNAAFHNAAFGCGGRMKILLYPLVAFFYPYFNQKLLIVGPRTEDDIIWARALGFKSVRGLDLFSYSPWIDIGDMHATDYPKGSFDAILLSWTLPYTRHPEAMISEMKRILKVGGILGLAWQSVSKKEDLLNDKTRLNNLNSEDEIVNLVGGSIQMLLSAPLNSEHRVVFTKY